jgi:hypothetical protein
MIAYYPLEELEPPKQLVVDPPAVTPLNVQVGLEESELAISDAIRA